MYYIYCGSCSYYCCRNCWANLFIYLLIFSDKNSFSFFFRLNEINNIIHSDTKWKCFPEIFCTPLQKYPILSFWTFWESWTIIVVMLKTSFSFLKITNGYLNKYLHSHYVYSMLYIHITTLSEMLCVIVFLWQLNWSDFGP